MIINKDFKEFIMLLKEHKVQYLVVGGYALAYYGYPRFTQDIDFLIKVQKENASKIIQVLTDFGFSSLGISEGDFLDAENIIQLGFPPNRIDILTNIDGVTFEEAYGNCEIFEEEGIQIKFIGLNDLIKNKEASGRLQDLADLEVLKEIKSKREK